MRREAAVGERERGSTVSRIDLIPMQSYEGLETDEMTQQRIQDMNTVFCVAHVLRGAATAIPEYGSCQRYVKLLISWMDTNSATYGLVVASSTIENCQAGQLD